MAQPQGCRTTLTIDAGLTRDRIAEAGEMIKFFTWARPNGYKVAILLEELGIAYDLALIDVEAGEQFAPDFVRLSPNSKIPALIDTEGPDGVLSLFESGLILMYLADKTGRFIAPAGRSRFEVLKWVFWQAASEGPWVGIYFFLRNLAEERESRALQKMESEALKRLAVMESRLAQGRYLGGDDYSIADIACYVITRRAVTNFRREGKLGPVPNLDRWLAELDARPGVQRGVRVPQPIDWTTANGIKP